LLQASDQIVGKCQAVDLRNDLDPAIEVPGTEIPLRTSVTGHMAALPNFQAEGREQGHSRDTLRLSLVAPCEPPEWGRHSQFQGNPQSKCITGASAALPHA
jgi:hypothetical protein